MKREYNLSNDEMAKVFCDKAAIPSNLIKNYYYLLADIFGAKNLMENSIIFNELKYCVSILSPREKEYIELRYGLLDSVFRNLNDINHSITTERARQILERGLRDLSLKKNRYNIHYRLEILKSRRENIDKEIEYYENIISSKVPINLTIRDFDLSIRAINALGRSKITTYEQLINLSPYDLLNIRNLGIKSANEIWFELHGEDIYQYIK